MLGQPLKFFVVFFVVVEPVSLIPLFTGLTTGAAGEYKRRMALRAVSVAAAILVLFALGGASFLNLMGISLEAFRIFGGLLLFLLSLEMVFARESGTRTSSGEARSNGWCDAVVAGVMGIGFFASAWLARLPWLRWVGIAWWLGELALFALRHRVEALPLAAALMLLLLAGPGYLLLRRRGGRAGA